MSAEKIIKKAALAYIGAIAIACEKTVELVDICAVKGARVIDEARPMGEEVYSKIKTAIDHKCQSKAVDLETLVDKLSDEECELLRQKLNKAEASASEEAAASEDAASSESENQ